MDTVEYSRVIKDAREAYAKATDRLAARLDYESAVQSAIDSFLGE